jgi:hypothetical protein
MEPLQINILESQITLELHDWLLVLSMMRVLSATSLSTW